MRAVGNYIGITFSQTFTNPYNVTPIYREYGASNDLQYWGFHNWSN